MSRRRCSTRSGATSVSTGRCWSSIFLWLGHALTGDLGTSFVTKQPVLGELLGRFIVTFQLTLIAALIAMTMGIATGLASARLRGRTDWIVRIYNGLILAVPNFVVATLIVLLAGLYFPQTLDFQLHAVPERPCGQYREPAPSCVFARISRSR